MQKQLLGQKVAFIVAKGFFEADLVEAQKSIQTLGADTRIISMDQGLVSSLNEQGWGLNFASDQPFQPAMRELMAHSVGVWESDAEKYAYHPVGYMQISPECMHADVATIAEQQKQIGYESVFIEGAKDSENYMRSIFDDWQAQGITSVLHEKRGGV